MINTKYIVITICVVVSAAVLLLLSNSLTKRKINYQFLSKVNFGQEIDPSSSKDLLGTVVATEKQRWKEILKNMDAGKAYAQLKKDYASDSFEKQHLMAHLFGELLYEKTGTAGIEICDDSFSFGCYHTFAISTILDKGVGEIKELDKHCKAKFGLHSTACQHGIGHGVLEAIGRENLAKTLEACWLVQDSPIYGCLSGLFMEYNLLTISNFSNSTFKVRKIDHSDPYSPCNKIEQKSRPSCYHELGQWWDKIYKGDYKKIGKLCEAVKNKKEKEVCYLGIGMVAAPSSQYDAEETIKKCQAMPEKEGEYLCRIEASWSMFFNPQTSILGDKICEGLPAEIKSQCGKDRKSK